MHNPRRPIQATTAVGSTITGINNDWRYGGRVDRPGGVDQLDLGVAAKHATPDLDDSDWQRVNLPHTSGAKLSWRKWEPAMWEDVWSYRHHFDAPPHTASDRVFVDFGAVMTSAVVSLNGTLLGQHRGGYLPFSFEITDLLEETDNILAVLVDGRAFQNVPPNLPNPAGSDQIDYWQPAGIHRDVALRVEPSVFLTAVAISHHDVLDSASRRSTLQMTIDAAQAVDRAWVSVELRADDGTRVAAGDSGPRSVEIGRTELEVELSGLDQVRLWDIDDPALYTVVTALAIDDETVHTRTLRTGYREARWEESGFYLNGRRRYLFGVNRHGLYPYVGFSMPDRVQRKDAEIIKNELNCNFVRCSHYPQTAAFLDACDELGLLVWEESPGWQYVGDSDWQDAAVRDITEMITRDRHRPSIVIWGARLNETPDRPAFYDRTEKLVKSLDSTRATSGTMLGEYSRTATFQHDVFSYDDYTTELDADGDRRPVLLPPAEGYPYLISEAISSRSSPTTIYPRNQHAQIQQHQSLDYANGHNDAQANERYAGLIAWVAFDYPAGFANHHHGLKTSGFGDVFRILKPGAAFYRSQVSPQQRAVVEPAFTWDPPEGVRATPQTGSRTWGPGPKAMICSNLDQLHVFLGEDLIDIAYPDRKRFPSLAYPPTFVDLTSAELDAESADLRIDGYLDDELVMTRRFAGDRGTDTVELRPDDAELVADGVDATRVVVAVEDRFGQPRGHSLATVNIAVDGPGQLIGDATLNLQESGAVAAIYVRTFAGQPGIISIKATATQFGISAVTVISRAP